MLGYITTPHLAFTIIFGVALISGFILGLVCPETWTTSLARLQLAIRWRTPIRLMHFLDDARERGVLRASDSVYQFRYPRFQDRLADQAHGVSTPA